jgi:hypothetical protein
MSNIGFPQYTIRPIDLKSGQWTREWWLFLQDLWTRSGGATGQSSSEIVADLPEDAGIEEIKADVYSLRDELRQLPPHIPGDDLDSRILSLLPAPLTKADLGLANVSNVDLTTWPGTTNITTLGTVTTGTWNANVVQPTYGGTGLSTYTVGDLIYCSATNVLSKLADVATGNALISGGVATAPSWGKIGLTTHVSGTLPVGNGGTGVTALSSLTANPSASVGLTAVNGSASTFMRSDAAPALDVSISPTWSGSHTFNNTITIPLSAANSTMINNSSGTTNALRALHVGMTGTDFYLGVASSVGGNLITGSPAYSVEFRNDAGVTFGIGSTKAVSITSGGTEFFGNVGFNSTAPISKPTVSGSRGGNAALASLLTALANYGLITDSTTA